MYIYLNLVDFMLSVGKYTSPMDAMGCLFPTMEGVVLVDPTPTGGAGSRSKSFRVESRRDVNAVTTFCCTPWASQV